MIEVSDALRELALRGYLFWIEGDHIAYVRRGRSSTFPGDQPAIQTRIKRLFLVLRGGKNDALASLRLIDGGCTPKERSQYRESIMAAIWDETLRSVIAEGYWRPSPATRSAEHQVETLWKTTLTNESSLSEFRESVHCWKKAGQDMSYICNTNARVLPRATE